jgi:hypothetical protein
MPSDAYASLIAPILVAFRTATHSCGDAGYNHYRAWHSWAIMNFAAAEYHAENSKAERERDRAARGGGGGSGSGGTAAAPKRGAVTRDRGASVTSPPSAAATAAVAAAATSGGGSGPATAAPPAAAPPATSASPPALSAHVIGQAVVAHAVAAVRGFFRSIALGRTRLKAYVLQDLLRLLTLWFTHGEAAPVRAALEAGLASGAVSVEVWLQVIPQFIARINIRSSQVAKLLQSLLTHIGSVHPQALVYPLTVACKSSSIDRRSSALAILGQMRRKWNVLVDQAEMVSRELIRVAILWHEMWHSGLEEASRQYFGEGNVTGMLSTLMPLHEMMTSPGPSTVREAAFAQQYVIVCVCVCVCVCARARVLSRPLRG